MVGTVYVSVGDLGTCYTGIEIVEGLELEQFTVMMTVFLKMRGFEQW